MTSDGCAANLSPLGVGIGWRPEIDLTVERLPGVDFVEVIAENIDPRRLPDSLKALRDRGVPVIPHGVSLSLGSTRPPDGRRLEHLAACADALQSPLVSEHIAYTRAGKFDAGHLVPLPRTTAALDALGENVRSVQAALPVPLALENVAPLFRWPHEEMTEGAFLRALVEQTNAHLLLDLANLHTAHANLGISPTEVLDTLPLERVAYVHVAGGTLRDGLWRDTHAHPVPDSVLDLLAELAARITVPGVLLEHDRNYPQDSQLAAELAALRHTAFRTGRPSRQPLTPRPKPLRPVGAAGQQDLQREQEDLLRCLTAGGPAPAGFDAERLAVQAQTLASRKARHSACRHAPRPQERNARRLLPRLLGNHSPSSGPSSILRQIVILVGDSISRLLPRRGRPSRFPRSGAIGLPGCGMRGCKKFGVSDSWKMRL
ncbi:DUF692 domain-containing protein [Streptomyces sp. NPDC007355]|uniref:DUF692 domain-containing protein n=1 Tax=Streptomyces sp. NPDC007355 TaxID=3364778 RepID=UPI0036AE8845